MKIKVISYSLTGNNNALATSIATAFSANHIKIVEPKRRYTLTIILDVLFKRAPKISPIVDTVDKSEMILFVGPVWLGQVATPFRTCFDALKDKLEQYAFISISGGANGPNPDLVAELKNRLGKEPIALINLYIADLLPPEPKPTIKVTSHYHITDKDIKKLTDTVIKKLQESMTN